ncbi:methyltransferase domain-containing protein [Paenibacillus agilis]|uniref:Small RNA 2'-O-methyltransferase n=1 Tax=Paenibacillus agilis TaxID=3020863 RepID=A0A559J178_9BACL|nr:methyltransferase domain-containing protein [Paenibacillus agilis]TVX93639.1 methyltransferase domain-containing protein [Paenibacillus agilis]
MAIVQLTSSNPRFTFLIRKNPHNGMILREVRKGIAYGWYKDLSTYNVYFKDADNEISYKQHKHEVFEYLNVSRYNTPLFPLNALNEFFSAPLKEKGEHDVEGYVHSFSINMIHIDRLRYIEFFQKHLSDYTFELQQRADKSYALKVTSEKSLYELLHVVSVLCLFLAMFGNENIDISDSIIEKYIKSMNIIDAPYYIRSLFVRIFLSSKDRYRKYKAQLEATSRYHIQFEQGGTAMQRRNFIGNILPFNKSILDVGCGEGFYAIPYAGKVDAHYYAVDINEDLLQVVQRKANAKEIDNIATYSSIDHFVETYNGEQVDVILTEVIEHMSEKEAKQLIQYIFTQIDFDHFIVTTPNADFNSFYELSEFRHDDHRWEMGKHNFEAWFAEVASAYEYPYEFAAIGDRVNDIATTQGVIVKKRGD